MVNNARFRHTMIIIIISTNMSIPVVDPGFLQQGVPIFRGGAPTLTFLSLLPLNSVNSLNVIISERLCRKLCRISVRESSRCSSWMRSVKEVIHRTLRAIMPEVRRYIYLDRSSRREVRDLILQNISFLKLVSTKFMRITSFDFTCGPISEAIRP